MSYQPMTADEAAKLNIKPEAVYGFEVTDAKDATSKKGSPMIALVLSFFDADGARFTVKDWLVHSDSRWAEKKCYDFAQAVNMAAKYASGTMKAEDCLGRSGFAMVGIEKGKPKDDGSGNFPDRNNVKYYTAKQPETRAGANAAPSKPTSQVEKDLDDASVPF